MARVSRNLVVVISAPSGAGKLTLLNKVREIEPNLRTTISATTRKPRTGETDGKDYYFYAVAQFLQERDEGGFVEWAEVHGNYYGTPRRELDRCLDSGHDVILELDVQGMRNLRAQRGDIVTVFLTPPSLEALEDRLRKRGTDDEAIIALRLKNARGELAARSEFDYIVVNDNLEEAAADMVAILRAERCRARRNPIGDLA
ncbi:MAG: guanylate kinase [Candidatus Hydrogenedentes bacterium]|nr:guanylate kinase [Candidatus Hydrogenedentota bacterium]